MQHIRWERKKPTTLVTFMEMVNIWFRNCIPMHIFAGIIVRHRDASDFVFVACRICSIFSIRIITIFTESFFIFIHTSRENFWLLSLSVLPAVILRRQQQQHPKKTFSILKRLIFNYGLTFQKKKEKGNNEGSILIGFSSSLYFVYFDINLFVVRLVSI